MIELKYPNVRVQLVDTNGNAYAVLGKVLRALKAAGVSKEECKKFFDEATAGNYDHMLQTCMRWVDVS